MVTENLYKGPVVRPYVADGIYKSIITGVSDVFTAADYNGSPVERIRIDVRTKDNIVLPLFVRAAISDIGDHSTKYTNSKLYDIMVTVGVVEQYNEARKSIFDEKLDSATRNARFVKFLQRNLIGREVNVLSKTVKPKEGEPYSVVERVMKIVNEPETPSNPDESAGVDTPNAPTRSDDTTPAKATN